jgi:hypothetical protein
MESSPSAVLDGGVAFEAPYSSRRLATAARVRAWVAPRAPRVLLAAAIVVAAVHGASLGAWQIDDAGITFAYARNLALGHGLVSQPGVAPVEGFSNPLWTLLLAPFFAVGAFDPVWTPKLVAFALLAATLGLLVWSTRAIGAAAWLSTSGALLLALDTPFVVWGMSGLENPLLGALLAWSAVLALRSVEDEAARPERLAGVVAGLLALTRPDAVVYAAAFPAVSFLARREGLAAWMRARVVPYLLGFAATFGTYLAFRRTYFGDWVPNTFHAKVRPWMLTLDGARLFEIATAAVGRLAGPVLVLIAVVALAGALGVVSARRVAVLATYLLAAAATYVLMPPDWMGEYRFATAFFIFFYWALGEALAWAWTALGTSRARVLAPALLVSISLESAAIHASRSVDFALGPTVPFARITRFAHAYDTLAATLGPGPHSLLTPDLGGMLFHARLRIYDLAGLCDRTIARTLMGDGAAFRDYVFATTRPTFIHVHATWADWAALHTDPRFARDYVPLHETWARPQGAEPAKGEPWAGDYVRREVVRSPAELARLIDTVRRLGIDRPLP